MLLTHALAFSASQFGRKKKFPRIYTSVHSGEFELTKLTYTRLEENLLRHRGDQGMQDAKCIAVPGVYCTGIASGSGSPYGTTFHQVARTM